MKKLYTLMVAMALVVASASAQAPRLKPFKSLPTASTLSETVFKTIPSQHNGSMAKAPRYEKITGQRALGYCEGTFNKVMGTGSLSYGDSLAGCIRFTKTLLSQYKGKKITALRIPIETVKDLKAVYGWVATNTRSHIVCTQEVANIEAGYVELTLDEPVEIEGTKSMYFGATYVLDTETATDNSTYCVPCNTNISSTSGGFYIGYAKSGAASMKWEDISSYGYGVFAIEAMVDGVEMSATDATLQSVSMFKENVTLSGNLQAYFSVKNNGANPINSFDIEAYVNGEKAATVPYTLSDALTTDHSSEFDLDVPYSFGSQAKGAKLEVKLMNVNGQGDDENMADNSASTTFNAYYKLFPQKVLVEEGTGQWCGYCPQGVVAMDNMHNKNLDDFVGVAVHSGYLGDKSSVSVDSMAFALSSSKILEYSDILNFSGYPMAFYNRQYEASAYYAETYYEYLKQFDATGQIYARAYWDGNNIVVSGDAVFGFKADDGSNYRVQTYLIEDEVGPYIQHNYYAGGAIGEMGGFENMPEWASVTYNDVLRGVYPDVPDDNTLGEQLTTGAITPWDVYQFSYTYEITDEVDRYLVKNNKAYIESGARYANKDNLRLAVVLIDASNDNAVVNCCKVAIAADEASTVKGIKEQTNAPVEYYSINGTRLDGPATKGVYIVKQGDKVSKRMAR